MRSIWIGLLVIGTGFQCVGAWQDSQTNDEAVHLTAGYTYWRTGNYRFNPEHPPLLRMLAAVPLLLMRSLMFSTTDSNWQVRKEFQFSAQFLYTQNGGWQTARWLLFFCRLPIIGIWALLAGILWHWSKKWWGSLSGLVTSSLYIFDPNTLGHGHLVTTDIGVTCGFTAAIWAIDRFARQPSWRRCLVLTLIFAATQLTKFSAIMLWIIVPTLLILAVRYQRLSFAWFWRAAFGLTAVTAIITWLVYQGEVRPVSSYMDHQPVNQTLAKLASVPVPAAAYLAGLADTYAHNHRGHSAYLLGQASEPLNSGWWYYFPVALVVKLPMIIATLFLLAVILLLSKRWLAKKHDDSKTAIAPWTVIVFVGPPLVFFLGSLISHINIGVRHIFPVFPFIYIVVGAAIHVIHSRVTKNIWAVVSVAGIFVTALAAWPNTIGYFSEAIGGTRQGYRYLLDSNLDWGQDFYRLRHWLDAHHVAEPRIAIFGSIPQNILFPGACPVYTDEQIASGLRPQGVVVISANVLYNPFGRFRWLLNYQPQTYIGSSVLIFTFPRGTNGFDNLQQ